MASVDDDASVSGSYRHLTLRRASAPVSSCLHDYTTAVSSCTAQPSLDRVTTGTFTVPAFISK